MAGTKRYNVVLDQKRIDKVVGDAADASAHRAARRTVDRVRSNISAAGRVDTGRMLQSTRLREERAGNRAIKRYVVYVEAPYARWQEEGHQTAWITPKRAKFLVFRPKGSGTYVFAKKVRGTKGAHFLRRALAALRVKDFV